MKQQDILKVPGDRTVCNKYFLKNTHKRRPEYMTFLTGGIVPSLEHLYTKIIQKKKCTLSFWAFLHGKIALCADNFSPETRAR